MNMKRTSACVVFVAAVVFLSYITCGCENSQSVGNEPDANADADSIQREPCNPPWSGGTWVICGWEHLAEHLCLFSWDKKSCTASCWNPNMSSNVFWDTPFEDISGWLDCSPVNFNIEEWPPGCYPSWLDGTTMICKEDDYSDTSCILLWDKESCRVSCWKPYWNTYRFRDELPEHITGWRKNCRPVDKGYLADCSPPWLDSTMMSCKEGDDSKGYHCLLLWDKKSCTVSCLNFYGEAHGSYFSGATPEALFNKFGCHPFDKWPPGCNPPWPDETKMKCKIDENSVVNCFLSWDKGTCSASCWNTFFEYFVFEWATPEDVSDKFGCQPTY